MMNEAPRRAATACLTSGVVNLGVRYRRNQTAAASPNTWHTMKFTCTREMVNISKNESRLWQYREPTQNAKAPVTPIDSVWICPTSTNRSLLLLHYDTFGYLYEIGKSYIRTQNQKFSLTWSRGTPTRPLSGFNSEDPVVLNSMSVFSSILHGVDEWDSITPEFRHQSDSH